MDPAFIISYRCECVIRYSGLAGQTIGAGVNVYLGIADWQDGINGESS